MAKCFFRKKLLRCKAESTYGTDPGTSGLTDVITRNLKISPLEGEELKLGEDKGKRASDLSSFVGKHVKLSFEVRASGAGATARTAGTPHKLHPLFLACAMAGTANAGTDYRYRADDDAEGSVTLRVYQGKQLHIVTGARGGWKFKATKKQYPWFMFEFVGIYNAVTAVTVPAISLTGWEKPVPFNAANVLGSLFANTLGLQEFEFDSGIKAEPYEHSELEMSAELDGFEARFNLLAEEPETGTLDLFGLALAETTGALSYVHGTTAGNIVEIAAPVAQIGTGIQREDMQGISQLRLQGPCAPNSSGLDYELVFK